MTEDALALEENALTAWEVIQPADRRFWLYDEMFAVDKKGMEVPRFSVQEVAKNFFGEGADWLRWRMRPDQPRLLQCTACKRSGVVDGKTCPACNGEGSIKRPAKHPDGFFILDGKPLEFKRVVMDSENPKAADPNAVTARYYTLADVERMGHALLQQEVITEDRLASIILAVRSCAYLYGIAEVRLPIVEADGPEIDHTVEEQ